jgi:NAD(P)H-nitrite reductase large subunit
MPDAIAAQANFDVNRMRLLIGDNRLLGAILIGDQTLSRALNYIIVEGIDISSIRDKILTQGDTISDVIADFWKGISPISGWVGNEAIKS